MATPHDREAHDDAGGGHEHPDDRRDQRGREQRCVANEQHTAGVDESGVEQRRCRRRCHERTCEPSLERRLRATDRRGEDHQHGGEVHRRPADGPRRREGGVARSDHHDADGDHEQQIGAEQGAQHGDPDLRTVAVRGDEPGRGEAREDRCHDERDEVAGPEQGDPRGRRGAAGHGERGPAGVTGELACRERAHRHGHDEAERGPGGTDPVDDHHVARGPDHAVHDDRDQHDEAEDDPQHRDGQIDGRPTTSPADEPGEQGRHGRRRSEEQDRAHASDRSGRGASRCMS